jgi:hypothetical protein
MSAQIQIVLPGLFDLPLGELEPDFIVNGLPGLNRILRLATALPNQAFSIDSILKTSLNLDTDAQLPMAQAFSLAEDSEPGRMLLASAIHLQAGLHSAVIVPVQSDAENLNDLDLIIKDLRDIFKVDCRIDDVSEGLYLMQLNLFDAPTHYPHILSVLGKTANPYIEQSRQVLPWYKLLNEIQMFMHQHEVNAQRLQRGLLAINSLWFWGAGSLPRNFDSNLEWYCDDLLLNRLATSLGFSPKPVAGIDDIDNPGDALLVDLRLLEFLKTGASDNLERLLLDIDDRLIKPALVRAGKNRARLLLRAGCEYDFELNPRASLKFWRQSRTLSSWAGQGADS